MKIKLSKSQWQKIGKQAGWIKTATGEMSWRDLEEGGEYYEAGQELDQAALLLQALTENKIKFDKVLPFDKYQGPYAFFSGTGGGKLWFGQMEGDYIYETYVSGKLTFITGEIRRIAKQLEKLI